ncbi:hypothetical protein KC19_11G115900 [Ceratodon purpureus]|uniref:Uncharacterized protein n=1 Tax=Ceratodon purpureus TaxID=3225 RepID=A0A8T0GG29_CERPU|nr:hypothetical protein KC19_11G115900 [Ceratodon purpureus]
MFLPSNQSTRGNHLTSAPHHLCPNHPTVVLYHHLHTTTTNPQMPEGASSCIQTRIWSPISESKLSVVELPSKSLLATWLRKFQVPTVGNRYSANCLQTLSHQLQLHSPGDPPFQRVRMPPF